MSKIKDLKMNSDNIVNFAEIFQGILPNVKSKYVELLLKLSKEKIKESHYYKQLTTQQYDIAKKYNFSEFNAFEVISCFFVMNEMLDLNNIDTFVKFCDYNEKNLIKNSDVTAIKTFDEINFEVSMVEIKSISKDMQKQVVTLFDNDEWLIIKPLTVLSSRKYGSNTKWCTTSSGDYGYFHQYTNNAILIYCLNKQTGYKVALHKTLHGGRGELSFWSQEDARIDSMEADLPLEISQILAKEVKYCKTSNRDFLSEEEKEAENKIFPYAQNEKMNAVENALVAPPAGRIQVRDAEEEMETMNEGQAPNDGPIVAIDEGPWNVGEIPEPMTREITEDAPQVVWSGPYVDHSDEQDYDDVQQTG